MIHRNALRCLAASLTLGFAGAARPATAQDVPKGNVIHIHMTGSRTNPEGSNPYQIQKVLPISKGICRGKNEKEDCKGDVAWVLKGPGLPAGWYVELRLKESATKKCFSGAPFALRNDNPVASGPIDEKACSQFDVWPYDVVLLDGGGQEKGREDPLVVINW